MSVDKVLTAYGEASDGKFNAELLSQHIEQNPQFRDELNRYAQVQLSSVRATQEEIEAAAVREEKLRTLFEHWCTGGDSRNLPAIERSGSGCYKLMQTQSDWTAWVAAQDALADEAEGWKLVPLEATPAMAAVGQKWVAEGWDWPKAVYRVMVRAAPTKS